MPSSEGILAGRRILIVEDEYFLADDLMQILHEHHAEILGPAATIEQWQLQGDVLHVVDPASRDSAAAAALAVGALLGRPIRGEHVSTIAPEASGKYRLVKR